jgi:hypothetical protein
MSTPPSSNNSSSEDKKNLFPPQKDDANCWNCLGLTIAIEKTKPRCYGMEYFAAQPASVDDMKRLESIPAVKKGETWYIIGKFFPAFWLTSIYNYF